MGVEWANLKNSNPRFYAAQGGKLIMQNIKFLQYNNWFVCTVHIRKNKLEL